MRVLIIEDERRMNDLIARVLRQEHYDVDQALDGDAGLELALGATYDLLIVDRLLPGLNGVDLIRHLRAEGVATPSIMLTALTEVPDRVSGLRAGADDYLGKPFAFDELLARMDALLRRRGPLQDARRVTHGDWVLDQETATIAWGDRAVALTQKEFALLDMLMRNRGRSLSRDDILEKVWGYEADPAGNVVELYIHYLRRKLGDLTAGGGQVIRTVRGRGYLFDEEAIGVSPH